MVTPMAITLLSSLVSEPAPERTTTAEQAQPPVIGSDALTYATSGMPGHLAEAIKSWCAANTPFPLATLVQALGIPAEKQKAFSRTIAAALDRLGYVNIRKMTAGHRVMLWVPVESIGRIKPTHSVAEWVDQQRRPFVLKDVFEGARGVYEWDEHTGYQVHLQIMKRGCECRNTDIEPVYFPPKFKVVKAKHK